MAHLATNAGTEEGTHSQEAAAFNESHTNAAAGSSTSIDSGSINQVRKQSDVMVPRDSPCLDLAHISEVLTMSAVYALSKQAQCKELILGNAADSIKHVCIMLCYHSRDRQIGIQG